MIRRAALIALFVAGGCFSELLEGPYVLATGLTSATSLAYSGRDTMFVASANGVFEMDGEGKTTRTHSGPALAVTIHPRTLYVLGGGELAWGPLPEKGAVLQVSGRAPAPGVLDIQAWCDGSVLLADASAITALDPETGESWAWAMGLQGLRAIALGPGDGCDYALAVTTDALLAVTPQGSRALASGLVNPRAAAADRQGRLWVVAGEPPELLAVEAGKTRSWAKHLGAPRDLLFGFGPLLKPVNAYMADAEGTVDYVHVP